MVILRRLLSKLKFQKAPIAALLNVRCGAATTSHRDALHLTLSETSAGVAGFEMFYEYYRFKQAEYHDYN